MLFSRFSRRGAGSSAVAPSLASVVRTAQAFSTAALTAGGDGLTFTGTGLAAGVQAEIDGTLYALTFVSSTTATAAAPAHAKGLVNVRLKNADGQFSGTQQLRYVVDPSASALTARMHAADFIGAAMSAQPTWNGRASATPNVSGTKCVRRRTDGADGTGAAAVANPTATTLNGLPAVSFSGSGCHMRSIASPATADAQSNYLDISTGYTLMFVGSFAAQAAGGGNSRLQAYGPQNGYGESLAQNGGYITSTRFDGTGYKTTPSTADVASVAGTAVAVFVRVGATANTVEIALGHGNWVPLTIAQAGLIIYDELCVGSSQLGVGDWVGLYQEFIAMKSPISDVTRLDWADYCTYYAWGTS